MNQVKAFVGHSFNPADKPVIDAFLEYLGQLTGILPYFMWDHATAAEPRELAEKVLALMEGKNAFIGICTHNEFAVAQKALKPTLWGNDRRNVSIRDIQAKTSDWIIQEIGLAIGRGMELVLLVEKGLRIPGGLQGNIEYIEFERENPHAAFGKIVEMIKALSPKAAGAPVASEPPVAKEEEEDEVKVADLKPATDWKIKDYKHAAFSSMLREDEAALTEIDQTFRASALNSGADITAEWDGNLEYLKVIFGKGGNLSKLRALVEQCPASPKIYVLLARTLSHYEHFEEAAKTFVQAAETPAAGGDAHSYRGMAAVEYAKAKKWEMLPARLALLRPP